MDAVGGASAHGFGQRLQLLFHLGDGIGVEQLAQVGIAQQIAQLLLIDGEGLGAALGQRRVAVVDVVGHVAEEQRRRKGRGCASVGDMHAHVARGDGAQHLEQRRHIEDIAHALAIRLQQHGKRRIARGDREQVVGSLALLPQRGAALARGAAAAAARAPQLSRNFAANSAVAPSWRSTRSVASAGSSRNRSGSGAASLSGKRSTNPSSPHIASTSAPPAGANAAGDRHGPGRVNAAAERRQHADAPVAQLVAHSAR